MPIKARRVKPKPQRQYANGVDVDDAQTRSRLAYRKNRDDFELVSCLRSLNFFEERAEHLPVRLGDSDTTVVLPVYKITAVAELLGKTYQTFWRWTKGDAIVPPPILKPIVAGNVGNVYHREEVRALITIIGNHERAFKYYRADHLLTRKKLFDQLAEIREKLKTENFNGNQSSRHSSSPSPRRIVRKKATAG